MRILQVISSFPPAYSYGGALKVVFDISKRLLGKGHDVTVYTTDVYNSNSRLHYETNPEIMDGIKVYHFRNISNTLSRKNFTCAPSMYLSLKNKIKDFEIIHLHEYRSFQATFVHHNARKYGIPYILQAHGSLPRTMAKQRLKWLYDVFFGYRLLRDASVVIAVNQVEVDQYREMGVSQEKIAIIPNGIDLSEYTNLPPKGCFKKKFGIKEEEKIVLYLGRIHKIKGIDILVKAFASIIRKLEDVRLIIVGPDDGYLGKIKFLIETENVKNNVLITGPLYGKDKLEAYVDADVYVLPSRYEIWGMTVLEAYSCGKCVIASSVGGLKDLVIEGVTGLLFTPKKIGQLAESLLFMLDDNTKAEDMGLKGERFVKENFAIEKVVDQLEALYTEVVYVRA